MATFIIMIMIPSWNNPDDHALSLMMACVAIHPYMTLPHAKPTSVVHSTIFQSKKIVSVRLQTGVGSGRTHIFGMASSPAGFPTLSLAHPARKLPVLTGERKRTKMMCNPAEARRLVDTVLLLPRVLVPVPVPGSPE